VCKEFGPSTGSRSDRTLFTALGIKGLSHCLDASRVAPAACFRQARIAKALGGDTLRGTHQYLPGRPRYTRATGLPAAAGLLMLTEVSGDAWSKQVFGEPSEARAHATDPRSRRGT
jgi:hypothetical protein